MARIALLVLLAIAGSGCRSDYGCCPTYSQPVNPCCNPCACQNAPVYSTYSATGQLEPIPQGSYMAEQPQNVQAVR